MSEITSRRPAPPVAYPKDRTRPDLADHAYFYFSHVGRFRRTNHPFFETDSLPTFTCYCPFVAVSLAARGRGLQECSVCLLVGSRSQRMPFPSVSAPIRSLTRSRRSATASRKPTPTPRSPDRSCGNQGFGMVFPEYTSALCRIFRSWRSCRLRLENETARADMSLYGAY